METQTEISIESLINIGFCQPKFYKPAVWLKAKKIMNKLCSIPESKVIPCNYGRGKGKYSIMPNTDIDKKSIKENIPFWIELLNKTN